MYARQGNGPELGRGGPTERSSAVRSSVVDLDQLDLLGPHILILVLGVGEYEGEGESKNETATS